MEKIRQTQVKRAAGNTRQGLKLLEEVLSSPSFSKMFEE